MDPKKKIQVFLENINSCNHQNMGNKFLDIAYTSSCIVAIKVLTIICPTKGIMQCAGRSIILLVG
jgi:hypothetical protein